MQTIEIDFEVYKELTTRRSNENVTYNEVIRELLAFPNVNQPPNSSQTHFKDAWIVKGVLFPAGTDFRSSYKGVIYNGKIVKSHLVVNGKYYNSPSAAAVAITGNAVNGWNFWEVRLPNQVHWKVMRSFRNVK